MEDPIVPFELHRMFLGDHPPLFYLEIVVRTALIYAYTLTLIRWVGGRSVAQLSMVDLLLVIALGSAVGDAPFYPDVPLLAAMVVVTVVVTLNKALDNLIQRSQRTKTLIDGRTVQVVDRGRILNDGLAHRDLSSLELKAMLRQAGISNLGQVEAAYLEAGGGVSVFRGPPVPGLAIVPPIDIVRPPALERASDAPDGRACCINCGGQHPAAAVVPDRACPDCDEVCWTAPVPPRDPDPAGPSH